MHHATDDRPTAMVIDSTALSTVVTDPSRFGLVVGGGSIGRRHAENLCALGAEVAVVETDADVRTTLVSDLDVDGYTSLTEALGATNPDFVVVATPNSTHVDLAIEAAEAGCHLFVEKPLSDRLERVDTLESIVADRDLITLVGCNLRFHPEIERIRSLLEQGVIGDVVAARIEGGSYLPDWFPESDYSESYSARPDLGGGVILDYIHEINYARWFFGEFQTVSAMASQQSALDIETNDVAGIVARVSDGPLCEFHLDYVQREYSRSCHIIGEAGTIRWSWNDARVEWYTAADDEWHTFVRPDDWARNDMYRDEMQHFLDCLQTGSETTCPISSGRRDLEVALAARESATSGRHVELPSR